MDVFARKRGIFPGWGWGNGVDLASLLFLLALVLVIAPCLAYDYQVEFSRLTLTEQCRFLDSDNDEEWAFTFDVDGTKKCLTFRTTNDVVAGNVPFTIPPSDPLWHADFSTDATFRVGVEAWEKSAGGPFCVFENSDNLDSYVRFDVLLDQLNLLASKERRTWTITRSFPTPKGNPCTATIAGAVTRKSLPGAPRIFSAAIETVRGATSPLRLRVNGNDFNPEPLEPPVLQISGVSVQCNSSSLVVLDTQLTCLLTRLASSEVALIQAQVQVQTRLGVSRVASVDFPQCQPACQNGTCWWSRDFGVVQCVCSANYYGDACQFRYPDDEPILADIAPMGADFSLNRVSATVIALSGRIWASDVNDTTVQSHNCVLTRPKTSLEMNAAGNSVDDGKLTVEVWRGPMTPYDQRPIKQADSLQLRGLCIVPIGTLSFAEKQADPLTSQITVSVEWARKFSIDSRESRDKLTFQLYGPLHLPAAIVKAVANEADGGEMRIFREQSVRVSFCDKESRPRVGGEDSDAVKLDFLDGPSLQPQLGIRGGDAMQFLYGDCAASSYKSDCAYFEYTVAFDLAGTYLARVLFFAPTALVNVGSQLTFEIAGLGDVTVPVPKTGESSISWAQDLANRDNLPIFSKNLAQTVSPNTGTADRAEVLNSLFEGLEGRWFMERKTVSLAIETGPSQADMGSVHVVRPQGLANEPFFCDTHTDQLDAGRVERALKPWHHLGNVPGDFLLSRMALSAVDCLASITVKVSMVHSSGKNTQITLTRTGPASNDPRAKNTTSTVIIKPFFRVMNSGVLYEFTDALVPDLALNFVGRPALADWVLSVQHMSGAGYVLDWWLDVTTRDCLVDPQEICGHGGGGMFARADNVDDTVRIECPPGGVISDIVWARYGRLEGDCTSGRTPSATPTVTLAVTPTVTPSVTPTVTPSVTPSRTPSVTPTVTPSRTPSATSTVTATVTPTVTPSVMPTVTPQGDIVVHDECEADADVVRMRVSSVCVGDASCELKATDIGVLGEPFLCADEQPPCLDGNDLTRRHYHHNHHQHQHKRDGGKASDKQQRHERDYARPRPFPGTEDFFLRTTTVRHATAPFFRQHNTTAAGSSRRGAAGAGADPCEAGSVPPPPKRALIVKARCRDAKAVSTFVDPNPTDKKLLVASASADFDNDWKDETVTLFGYEGGGPLHAAFTFVANDAFQPTTFVVRNLVLGGGDVSAAPVAVGGQLEVQAGDFDNDGYPELVIGFLDARDGQLQLFQWDLRIENVSLWTAGVAKPDRTDLRPCGCFDKEAILRRLFALARPIVVPGGSPKYHSAPLMTSADTTRLDSPGFSYALAVGDVGLGYDALAVTWIVSAHTVACGVYQQTASGLVLSEPMMLRGIEDAHAVSLVLGDFEGTGSCELALGVVDYNYIKVYFYSIDQTVASFPMTMASVLDVAGDNWILNPNVNLRMVAGDLNDDHDAELVVGYTLGAEAYLHQFDTVACSQLKCMGAIGSSGYVLPTGRVPTTATTRSPEIKLAIGNVDESSTNELVVAVEYTSTANVSEHKVMLVSLTAQPDPERPFSINGRHCYLEQANRTLEGLQESTINNIALSVGNLFGLGYRVGEPTMIRYESVPELLAVVNAPPTHYDFLNGQEIAVNQRTLRGYGSFTKLINSEGVTSSFEVTRETVTVGSTADSVILDGKLAVVVGKLHTHASTLKKQAEAKGKGVVETISVTREIMASGDDSVLYISTTRDQWKFPIVDQAGVQVGALDVWLSSSCGVECVQVADGRDLWWFTPDHEPFNVLTYPSRAPSDFVPSSRVMVGDRITLGPNEHQQWVAQHSGRSQNKIALDHRTSTRQRATGIGVDVNYEFMFAQAFLGVGPSHKLPLGINVHAMKNDDTEAAEEESDSQTMAASIERDVSVQTYLEPINAEYAYRVQPYVWLARTADGREYLKVDYMAEPGYHPGVATWWQRTYNKPDPAFNLPWWWAATYKRDRTMLTKEMVATPAFPAVGELVHVTVTVRNKALVSASQVDVSFWRGSPDNCFDLECLTNGHSLIGSATIDFIPAQGKRDVSFLMRYNGVQNIHVTLDDNEQLEEMHEDNNHAYALLFHNVHEDGYTLQTLRLGKVMATDALIGAEKHTTAEGAYAGGYTLTATVLGDTFTRQNLVAQFWHGAVGAGGRLIATLSVPRLEGSVSTPTAYELRAYWHAASPDLHGHEQELHAVLLHSGFEPTPENVISHVSRKLSVACFGEVDLCGVCGGFNRSCVGCDGVVHSGLVIDVCGQCGGDNSSCCVPRPAHANFHRVRLHASDNDGDDGLVRRIKVGDLVVWENMLDWDVEIVAGALESTFDQAAFELSAVRDHGHSIPTSLPDVEDLGAFTQQYVSMPAIKDHVDSAPSDERIQVPEPDSTAQYLRRRSAGSAKCDDSRSAACWRVMSAGGFVPVARDETNKQAEKNLSNERFEQSIDDDDDEDEMLRFAMSDVCCVPPTSDDQNDHEAREDGDHSPRAGAAPGSGDHKSGRPLRSLLLSMLKENQRKVERLHSVVNSTTSSIVRPEVEQMITKLRMEASVSFYEPDDTHLHPVGCLCPPIASLRSHSKRGGPGAGAGSLIDLFGRFDFDQITGASKNGSAALAPGGASMPHRFFTPGVYLWHDARHPALHGALIVEPSTYTVDPCGVCGGDGKSCVDCRGTPYGMATLDENGVCTGGIIDCAGVSEGTAVVDSCGQCTGGTTGLVANYTKDCNGVCAGSAQVDSCGQCTGGTTGLAANYTKDCNGVCAGSARLDSCGQCTGGTTGRVANYTKDCNGVCAGSAQVDSCGQCTGGTTGRTANYTMDCNGVCAGSARVDSCGQCTGGTTGRVANYTKDCAGVCAGSARVDSCGQCTGGTTGLAANYTMDCNGVCSGPARLDSEGRCPNDITGNHIDCARVYQGTAVLDSCGQCTGGTTGLTANYTKDCAGVCSGSAVVDDCGRCTGGTTGLVAISRDCAGVCSGSARVDACGQCTGGTTGLPINFSMDCNGVCFGLAQVDSCGQCTGGTTGLTANFAMDCAGVCRGSARIDKCYYCTGGTTGLEANFALDCMGDCFGLARINECGCTGGRAGTPVSVDCLGVCGGTAQLDCAGVCGGTATRNAQGGCNIGRLRSEKPPMPKRMTDNEDPCTGVVDCANTCNGTAVVDDCGVCVGGYSGVPLALANSDKDCAGVCFGNRSASDPACTCPMGQLDACFVCDGDNSTCTGCDGVLLSGATRDLCGVCGGDSSSCCFLPFPQVSVAVRGFEQPIAPHRALDVGETLALTNLHADHPYTFALVRVAPQEKGDGPDALTDAAWRKVFPTLPSGHSMHATIAEPGEYALISLERPANELPIVRLSVRYNAKRRDACGHCVYMPADHDDVASRGGGEVEHRQLVAYGQCCKAMGSDNVHAWYETTHYVDAADPTNTTHVVERTGHYRSAPARHLLRLVAPQTIDSETWSTNESHPQRLAVGDVFVLENRDTLDHVISITGPQPLPDVVLNRGTSAVVGPLFTPGTYQVTSDRNVVNTSFVVEFAFACTVHAQLPAGPPLEGAVTMEDWTSEMALPVLAAVGLVAVVVLAVTGLMALVAKTRRLTL